MATRLTDCRPRFIRFERHESGNWAVPEVATLEEAQGIRFRYPETLPHILAFENAPPDCGLGPGRWLPSGTGFADLTLGSSTGARSVRTRGVVDVHFFVTDGLIEDC